MSEPARKQVAHVMETPVAANPPTSMMEALSQAIRDPNLNMDNLERMAALYERLTDRQAETAFNEAMNEAQADLGPVAADANNPQTKSKYASYPTLDRVIRPVYSRHGFSLSFGTDDGAPADYVRVSCRVSHRAGHSRNYHVDMPADGKGAKGGDVMTKTHAVGAAMSYGQRYLLKLVFNIAVGDDRDGNAPAGQVQLISVQQLSTLNNLMEEAGADRDKFLNYLQLDTLAHVPAKRYGEVVNLLAQKKAAAAKVAAQGASDFPGDR